ncbi:DoxX family protein [Amycolatopsis sp. NPDC024027]|uniref:DoxX family protein n=1 Tax=Amycolatopsis sp. NPDC024027 TaxID=3154327 RepID=UPI0033CFB9DE
MNVVTWVARGLLAFAFLAAGGAKLVSPREKLLATGKLMAWVEDFQDPTVKVIGVLEFLGAVGVLPPDLVGIAPGPHTAHGHRSRRGDGRGGCRAPPASRSGATRRPGLARPVPSPLRAQSLCVKALSCREPVDDGAA